MAPTTIDGRRFAQYTYVKDFGVWTHCEVVVKIAELFCSLLGLKPNTFKGFPISGYIPLQDIELLGDSFGKLATLLGNPSPLYSALNATPQEVVVIDPSTLVDSKDIAGDVAGGTGTSEHMGPNIPQP